MLSTLALVTTSCSPEGGNTIKVGAYCSLTGKEATFGTMTRNGTELAIQEANAAGGVLGKKIELLVEDNQSKSGESITVVKKLIARDKVVAVLGEVASTRSLEAAPVCQEYKIPMISPSSTNPKVTEVGNYIFRVCFIDPLQGKWLANFSLNSLKAKRVGLLIDVQSDYSLGLAENFKKSFLPAGGEITAERNYNGGDKDFRAQLTAIKAGNPEAIFVPGYYTDVGLIVRQARELGITVPLLGGDGWESSKVIEIAGPAIEGCFFSTHFSPDEKSARVEEFVKKFKAKYNETPDAMAALGYDSALVLVDAIKRAGTTEPAKLRDAIAATKNFEGVAGTITLDEHRNATKSGVMLTIENGKFKFVEKINP